VPVKLIYNPSPADIAIANHLDPAAVGIAVNGGIHGMTPSNWAALCAAGVAVAGCTYQEIDPACNLRVSVAAQARDADPTYTTGLDAGQLSHFVGKLAGSLQTLSGVFAGDSITFGLGTPNSDGFRVLTNTNLLARELRAQWAYVGTQASGSVPTTLHNGISGRRTAQLSADIAAGYGSGKIRFQWIRVEIGTNDAIDGMDAATYAATFATLLSTIKTAEPAAGVSVARHIPDVSAPVQALLVQYNAALTGVIATAVSGGQFVIFEADAGLINPTDYIDGRHPNQQGCAKIAPVAADGIVAALTLAGTLP